MKGFRTTIAWTVCTIIVVGILAMQRDGIWRLSGFTPMTTVHSFVIVSPDEAATSRVTEYMDGDDYVYMDIEHLTPDHQKTSQRLTVKEYREYWDRVKDFVVPGSDKEEFVSQD